MCPELINSGNRGSARLGRMRAQGEQRFDQLLKKFGGLVNLGEAADLLGIPEAAVLAKADRRELLTVRQADSPQTFPRFQFEDTWEAPHLEGLPRFLAAVPDWDDKTIIRFLLVRHNPQRSDETPLDLIRRNQVEKALELASQHYEQRP